MATQFGEARRRVPTAALLAAGAVLLGLIVALLARGEFRGRYGVPTGGGAEVTPPVPAPAAVAPAVPMPASVRPAAPRVIAPPVVAPAQPAPAVEDHDQRRIAGALERTTLKALRRGEPVRWHKAGQRGFVTVSDAADKGGRICRNVAATITGDDGDTQSSAHLWCAPQGTDDWAPAG